MSHTRTQLMGEINPLVVKLLPMFDWLEHSPILQVTGEESRAELKIAYSWLREVDATWSEEYHNITTQTHTGPVFWNMAKVHGIEAGSMHGDLPIIVEMRRFVKKLAKFTKNPRRPVLFGGVAPKKRGRPRGDGTVQKEG